MQLVEVVCPACLGIALRAGTEYFFIVKGDEVGAKPFTLDNQKIFGRMPVGRMSKQYSKLNISELNIFTFFGVFSFT